MLYFYLQKIVYRKRFIILQNRFKYLSIVYLREFNEFNDPPLIED